MDQVFNVHHYHWIAYLFGLFFAPRPTILVFFTIYFGNIFPTWLLASGWVVAIVGNLFESWYVNSLKEKKS